MFLFIKSAKEKTATAGVLVLLCLLALVGVGLAGTGGFNLIPALLFLLVAVGIAKGVKGCYTSVAVIFGALALLFPLGTINPLAVMDAGPSGPPVRELIYGSVAVAAFLAFLSWSLMEHGRLRSVLARNRTKIPGKPLYIALAVFYALILVGQVFAALGVAGHIHHR